MAEDVITLITQDHRALEQAFDVMAKEPDHRLTLLPVVVAMLTAHSQAEEERVYPVVAEEAGAAQLVEHSVEEHHLAEQLGLRLLTVDPHDQEFDQGLAEFAAAVRHHVEEEESRVLPALRRSLGPVRLRQLARAFAEQRAERLTGRRVTGVAALQPPTREMTRAELYEEARELGVEGRSLMNKEELIEQIERMLARHQ